MIPMSRQNSCKLVTTTRLILDYQRRPNSMSLYTPVFPPLHEFNSSQKVSLENNSLVHIGTQPNYVKYLRDLHLFLSTQNDVLSPPSRPNSPSADQRIQKMKSKIQDIFGPLGGETSSGKWTRAGQTLKLRCATGRNWSVSRAEPYTREQNMDWILPDEESEWIEWEKKRENRRLKGKTNTSQRIDSVILATPESQKHSFAGLSQRSNTERQLRPPDVSPGTLRAAAEKVRKWQASMVSERCHDTSRSTAPASVRVTAASEGKRETAGPQRSRTLGFAVVKPAAKPFTGKKRKGSVSHPAIRDNLTPALSRKSKTPTKTFNVPNHVVPVDDNKVASERPARTPPIKYDTAKIANVSETVRHRYVVQDNFNPVCGSRTCLHRSHRIWRRRHHSLIPRYLFVQSRHQFCLYHCQRHHLRHL